ncbi:diacylglycerol/lipid kinase family protein [Ornithinimicrobium avium]|uniref:Diacylglycerol kinase family lipid kinase n=1 Tax=Ornithinimicrobium avium TaxID=2283195 RepID=A0A345NPN3_9MICO|nr:diacylglycerol kinase family protein [Ornithinimicrobium avium]AXH96991.1 diacylglycerol kinase family lipid kinase [Ornithinimicrobium avium]
MESAGGGRRAAVVVNPTKFTDVGRVRRQVGRACGRHGWEEPLWLETTAEDTGTGQTREALAAGVDLVCALGGDGTVRTVGAELAGTATPMGLLPGGTGNLLARNLELPIDSLDACLEVALTGQDMPIDTCLLDLVRPAATATGDTTGDTTGDDAGAADDDRTGEGTAYPRGGLHGEREEHVFLVMAGLGFDAEVMATAPEKLKARVGWPAYIVSGLQHLKGPQFTVVVKVDGAMPFRRRVRSVMAGNVGKLQGGMDLLPDALADDASVDAVLLSPEGVVGWAATIAQLSTRRRFGHSRVDHVQGQDVRVVCDRPVAVEIDGDPIGEATAMRVVVQPGNLVVRVPGSGRRRARRDIDALSDEQQHPLPQPHHDGRVSHRG